MSDDAAATPVVWIGESTPREDAARALAEWGRARGIRLVPLDEASSTSAASSASSSSPPIDLTIADRAEKELDRAREAIGATDADAAERALSRADTLLREHPELPQAPWLRAEVERAWSQRWLRMEPRDEARARTAWENAHAIDGGRVAGVGETAFPPRAKVTTTVLVFGANPSRFVLRLDGNVIEPTKNDARGWTTYRVEIAPAEHHLVATSEGRVVFASWIAIVGPDPAPTRLTIADASACSREQLSDVRRGSGSSDDNRVIAPSGVSCPQWVAAVPGERQGSVLVARCERDQCGPLLEWRVERLGGISGPPQALNKGAIWPAWATWTLVGIGAATATSMALVATGVFESRPIEQRFVVGGARQE